MFRLGGTKQPDHNASSSPTAMPTPTPAHNSTLRKDLPISRKSVDVSASSRYSSTGTLQKGSTVENRPSLPNPTFRPFEPPKPATPAIPIYQRQSLPVSRLSTSSIKPRNSISSTKTDNSQNELNQKRIEELARENVRLRNELNKVNVSVIEY